MPIDKKKLQKVFKSLSTKFGDDSIFLLESSKTQSHVKRWSTGIANLDDAIGGGMPYGRIVEISGKESAGKTSLAYHLAAQQQFTTYIPIEGTFDQSRAKVFGCSKHNFSVFRANCAEDAFDAMLPLIEAGVPLIVLDSIPYLIPKKFMEENDFDKEARIGMVASFLTKAIPRVQLRSEQTGATLLFVNQIRETMNSLPFGEKEHTPGGRLFKHSCSLRLKVTRRAWIEVPNKNPKITSANEKVGILQTVKVEKSKISNPGAECTLAFMFDRGYVPVSTVNGVRLELMERNRQLYGGRLPKTDGFDESLYEGGENDAG